MSETAGHKPSRIELYTHEPPVNWLEPGQLLRTGMQAAIAATIGAFTDPREVKAALRKPEENIAIDLEQSGTFWMDYVADTGDGWDATYSVAWCLCKDARHRDEPLPRPRTLVLGGDQVYPTPARGGYRTRFVDPFRSANPAPVTSAPGQDDAKALDADAAQIFATPGNHDWYDGLRGFSEVFCSKQPVGRWQTRQNTSYFALKLRPGWWLWGLDLQLESEIDQPQLNYFQARSLELAPDDRVVLCTPEPSWINESERLVRGKRVLGSVEMEAARFRSLRKIEEMLKARLAVVIAGDDHHYAHYTPSLVDAEGRGVPPGAPHRITCGGGGAYLLGTHLLQKKLRFQVDKKPQAYEQTTLYPDDSLSRKLRNGAWRLPTKNIAFCSLLAALYLLFIWMLQSASKIPNKTLGGLTLMESLSGLAPSFGGLCAALKQVVVVAAHSPSASLFAAAIVFGAAQFSMKGVKRLRWAAGIAGTFHGVLHLLLAVALLWGIGWLNLVMPTHFGHAPTVDNPWQVISFIVEAVLLGGFLGGLLFGIWLVAANAMAGQHGEEVYSSQRIDDYRCFLRMRFDDRGLTIFPMKIDKICRRWKLGPGVILDRRQGKRWRLRVGPDAGPRFVPDGPEPVAEALADPIFIPNGSGGTH